ncbi:MAG: hypothetical protein JXX29_05575 [Deltaproteobacteria bacterium]|nr:hypothetical protein [Deltaproteobacteria bacterium]MBN2671119.1 hypothetical protein [Deltaproteobacteria bacterium]
MINTAQLQRLDRRSIEAKAVLFAAVVCLILWMSLGVTVKLLFDDWYGFGLGFIVSALLSGLVMWILFIRPTAKERRVVRASWRGDRLRVFDPIDRQHEEIDFSKAHKAILILSKMERQFLLRIEQKRHEDASDVTRIDIIGPMPMVLPMRVSGEAASLFGFYSIAKMKEKRTIPYRLKETADRDSLAQSLLKFVESHKQTRNNEVQIKREGDIIKLCNGSFSLLTRNDEILFNNPRELSFHFKVQTTSSTATQKNRHKFETAEIFMALVPPTREKDALVFSVIAPSGWTSELPNSWNVPPDAEKRKFTLYDDSVNSYVVTKTLKNYIKLIAPNNPVLDVLRH